MRTRPSGRRARAALALTALLGGAALTGLPAPAANAADGPLTVQYRTSAGGATADQSEPWLKIRNTGSAPVQLNQVKIRYYFKADTPGTAYRFACSWAVVGCSAVTGTFGTLPTPTATADRYLEIGFTPSARHARARRRHRRPATAVPPGRLADAAAERRLLLRRRADVVRRLGQGDRAARGRHRVGRRTRGRRPDRPPDPTDPPGEGGQTLFDDFDYASHTDPDLSAHGWNVRSNAGGPGVPGATWDPSKVTFSSSGGNSVMDLETSTAGTGASTTHTEILTRSMKFAYGTYAARVRFSDAPVSGPDGDRVVQTFFTINDLKAPMADDYAEYDFEYLPNGGWGEPSSILYTTSWETYNPDPWQAVNQHSESRRSFAGLARPGRHHRRLRHQVLHRRQPLRHP